MAQPHLQRRLLTSNFPLKVKMKMGKRPRGTKVNYCACGNPYLCDSKSLSAPVCWEDDFILWSLFRLSTLKPYCEKGESHSRTVSRPMYHHRLVCTSQGDILRGKWGDSCVYLVLDTSRTPHKWDEGTMHRNNGKTRHGCHGNSLSGGLQRCWTVSAFHQSYSVWAEI